MVRARLRARRTKLGVSAMPIAMISFPSVPPSAVTMMSASSRVGNAISMSALRMMAVSRAPPRVPARMPSGTPTRKPQNTEARPTCSETRAPQMMRLRMSRPNSSVPSRWRSTAPGPLSTASEYCADGLSGAMRGAAAASTIMATAIRMPSPSGSQRRRCPPRDRRGSSRPRVTPRSSDSARGLMAIAIPGLPVGDPRVDDRVEHVDGQVDDDDDHGEHGDGALGERVVPGPDGVHQHLAEPGAREHGLGEHGAGQRDRHEEPDDGEERDHHVAERVLVDHRALDLPLGPRGADVVLADHLQHGRAR